MNFFLVAAIVFALRPSTASTSYTARQVFERCKTRVVQIDSSLAGMDIRFKQKIEMKSRTGDMDSLVFEVTVDRGRFQRRLIFSSVPNDNRFNGGYDAFNKLFLLSEYFSGEGRILTSCDFDKSQCRECYTIRFGLSSSADSSNELSEVTASMRAASFTPIHIDERVKGLPLGVEFENNVDVAFDRETGIYFPKKIVMQVFGSLFFLKGEVALITIRNEDLRRL